MPSWSRRRVKRDDPMSSLLTEIERLRQENMRLRLERQRPANVSAVVDELRMRVEAADTDADSDEAYHVLAQVETTRRALLDALDGLAVAVAQMKRQLTTNVSIMEIDRRLVERRRAPQGRSRPPEQPPRDVPAFSGVGSDRSSAEDAVVPHPRALEAR